MRMGLEIPRDKPSTILMELITSLQIPSAQSVMLYWQNVVCLTIQNSLGFYYGRHRRKLKRLQLGVDC